MKRTFSVELIIKVAAAPRLREGLRYAHEESFPAFVPFLAGWLLGLAVSSSVRPSARPTMAAA